MMICDCDIYIVIVTFYCFQPFFYVSYNFVAGAAASLGSDTLAKEILFISMRLEKKKVTNATLTKWSRRTRP